MFTALPSFYRKRLYAYFTTKNPGNTMRHTYGKYYANPTISF